MSNGNPAHGPQPDSHRWGQPGAPVPTDILEQLDQDITASGGEW